MTLADELQRKLNRLERDAEHLDENSIELKVLIKTFRRVEQQLEELTGRIYV